MVTRNNRGGTAAVETLAFGCELAMLVVLVIAGIGLGPNVGVRIVLAIALPLLAILVWARWMAPTSRNRLADPARLIGQYLLFLAAGALAVIAGRLLLGIVFAVVAMIVFGLARLGQGVSAGSAD